MFHSGRKRPLRHKGEPVRVLFDAPSARPAPTEELLLPIPNAAHGVLESSQLTEGACAAFHRRERPELTLLVSLRPPRAMQDAKACRWALGLGEATSLVPGMSGW